MLSTFLKPPSEEKVAHPVEVKIEENNNKSLEHLDTIGGLNPFKSESKFDFKN